MPPHQGRFSKREEERIADVPMQTEKILDGVTDMSRVMKEMDTQQRTAEEIVVPVAHIEEQLGKLLYKKAFLSGWWKLWKRSGRSFRSARTSSSAS